MHRKITPRQVQIVLLLALAAAGVSFVARAYSARSGPAAAPLVQSDFVVVRAYYDDYQMVHDLSTWTEPWGVNREEGYVELGVTRADLELLGVLGFRVEIDEEATRMLTEPRPPGPQIGAGGYATIPGFACYRTVEGTYDTAEDIVAAHPTLAAWVDAGDSWEKETAGGAPGYDLMVLVLTNQAVPGPKPKLFVTSSIHAREYTPAELMTRFAEYLVDNYDTDPDVTWILDHHEVHLMLHANPDGRKWAETGLFWRKNTDNNFCANSNNRGVDLNRNFSFQWNCCGGSSGNQCSEVYRGPSAGSEPETDAVQEYLRSIFPDQKAGYNNPAPVDATGIYLDVHSSGELVIWPWGHAETVAPNGTALQTFGRKLAYFNDYSPFQAIDLYITDGTTDDFGYGDLGVAAYTFELGTSFFQSCSTFNNAVVPDNLPALLFAAKNARTPYMTPAGPEALNLSLSDDTVPAGTPVTLTATLNDTRFNNSEGTEPVQDIAAAEYYIDVPYWGTSPAPHAMAPADGNFNTAVEGATAVLDTTGLPDGRHIVYVRGQDASGNWGVVSAVFLWIEGGGPTMTPSPTATATATPTPTATTTPGVADFYIYLPVVVRE